MGVPNSVRKSPLWASGRHRGVPVLVTKMSSYYDRRVKRLLSRESVTTQTLAEVRNMNSLEFDAEASLGPARGIYRGKAAYGN